MVMGPEAAPNQKQNSSLFPIFESQPQPFVRFALQGVRGGSFAEIPKTNGGNVKANVAVDSI